MSKLDWEKQNRVELLKEKRRVSNRTKVLNAYENGAKNERERIIKLLETQSHDLLFEEHETFSCSLCTHLRLIKGEQK